MRRSVEQARANTEAQAEAANDALVMLEGQVAQAYVQLRGAQALSRRKAERAHRAGLAHPDAQRQRQGLATELDVEQAQTQLDNYQRQLPGYEKQIQQAMNRLSVLTGQAPGALDALLRRPRRCRASPTWSASASRPRWRGGARTYARRKRSLHAATANIGVAVASFYPDVSLTGNLGMRAIDASYLTDWASRFYSVGPSLSLPIFQGGRLTASLRLARAQEAEAALSYRGTVLNALREVEDALVAYRTDRAARDKLDPGRAVRAVSHYLALNSYTHGLSDFLQVLDAERTLVATRQQLVQADMMLANRRRGALQCSRWRLARGNQPTACAGH